MNTFPPTAFAATAPQTRVPLNGTLLSICNRLHSNPRRSLCADPSRRRSHTCAVAGGAGTGPGAEKDETFIERIRSINQVNENSPTSEQVSNLVTLASTDKNAQVRYTALSRLSNLNIESSEVQRQTDEILSAARHALTSDSEPSCRSAAADMIAGLRLNDGFDDLVNAFNDDAADWVLKFSICAGIGYMMHPQSYDFLSSVLAIKKEEWDNATTKDAAEPVPVTEPTQMDDSLLIAACVGALGDLGDARALSLVQPFTEHPDSAISERAKNACDILAAV